MSSQLPISIKEARKKLGKNYSFLLDDEVEQLVLLLSSIAQTTIESNDSNF